MYRRRRLMQAGLGLTLAPALARAASHHGDAKVLRIAFDTAETSFDPAKIYDSYSASIASAIFEAPLEWDYLARPCKLVPLTAATLPEVSTDFRTWTVRLAPETFFADDPAFKGRRRELVASDYVYACKRIFDPALGSAWLSILEPLEIVGMAALRQRALETKRPFDYDSPVEGLRALDRYTFQIKLARPAPRFAAQLASHWMLGAVAREVVEHYGDAVGQHPVGTGAFRLGEWRRSSHIVLERNPGYRDRRFAAEPAQDDAEGNAVAARLAGKRLPLLDRIEIAIIEEAQPRWLAFLQGDLDLLLELPNEYAPLALPNNELAPYLARAGVRARQTAMPIVSYLMFNMEDGLVGGYTPEKVALRRAISLAYDVGEDIRLMRSGQAVPAHGALSPQGFGFDAQAGRAMSQYDPARANALLDLYGYLDRDGDGYRERPDGRPLVIESMTEPDQRSRRFDELLQRKLRAVGLKVRFRAGQWPENAKAARAGKFMLWSLAFVIGSDSEDLLALAYGPTKAASGGARFDLPAYDALFRRQAMLPDGPERAAVLREASALLSAYMPYKFTVWRTNTDLMHPQVRSFRRHPFASVWSYIEVDGDERSASLR